MEVAVKMEAINADKHEETLMLGKTKLFLLRTYH